MTQHGLSGARYTIQGPPLPGPPPKVMKPPPSRRVQSPPLVSLLTLHSEPANPNVRKQRSDHICVEPALKERKAGITPVGRAGKFACRVHTPTKQPISLTGRFIFQHSFNIHHQSMQVPYMVSPKLNI